MNDSLILEVHDLVVHVLTGIYSQETHLPQPLRIDQHDAGYGTTLCAGHTAVGVQKLYDVERGRDKIA